MKKEEEEESVAVGGRWPSDDFNRRLTGAMLLLASQNLVWRDFSTRVHACTYAWMHARILTTHNLHR